MSQSPIRPLNVGNVVSTGFVLYRSHLKLYFGIALRATFWLLLPFLVLIPTPLLTIYGRLGSSLLWLVIPLWLALLIYCLAKYFTNSALLSRLAFGELVDKPESVNAAHSQTHARLWSFLRLALLIFILLVLVYFGLAIADLIFFAILAFIPILGLIIGSILAVGIVLGGLTWFFSRWIVADVSLAVEEYTNVGQSIDRSWELTQASVMRIQGVVMVAFLLTLPFLFLTNYLPKILLLGIQQGSSLYWSVYYISLLTSLVGGAVVMPFWQAVKAVIYYDLRSRREGLGLLLRDR